MNSVWKHRFVVSALVAVTPVAALGCGGGSSSTDSQTSLTKTQLLKVGNEACAKRLEEKDAAVKKALEELPEDERLEPSGQALEELGESVLPPYQNLIDDFSSLPAAKEAEATIEKIVAELEAGVKQTETEPESLAKTDPFAKASESAKSYGFDACTF